MFAWVGKFLNRLAGALSPERNSTSGIEKTVSTRASAMRPFLSGRAPGLWASNHYAECQHVTGWNFCAIRALAQSSAAAQLAAYEHLRPDMRLSPEEERAFVASKTAGQGTEAGQSRRRPLPESFPLVQLLKRPNPEQSGAAFRFQCAQQIATTSTALVWIVRNRWGVPIELYVLPTGLAIPQGPSAEYPMGSYRLAPVGSWECPIDPDGYVPTGLIGQMLLTGAVFDARDVKPVRWPHPFHLSDGLAPMRAGQLEIDVSDQITRARWYNFRNASQPGMVFSVSPDVSPSPEDREAFREDLKARASGTPNTGRDLLMPPGVESERMERSPVEMDYVLSHPQMRDTVLALYGTPPIAVGITEAGSYAALYASLLQYTELTLQPLLDLISDELTEALGPAYGEGLEIVLTAKAINDPDVLERRLRNDIVARCITINEMRALRGLPPVPWGNVQVGTDILQQQLQEEAQAQQQQAAQQLEQDRQAQEAQADGNGEADEDGAGIKDPTRAGMPRKGWGADRLDRLAAAHPSSNGHTEPVETT